jgi:hypothetical protein
MGSTHTYLVFRADDQAQALDVVVDVTYRQFLVITEWMEGGRLAELMDAAAATGLFDGVPEWFVGTDQELAEVFTAQGLKEHMERAVAAAGYGRDDNDDEDAAAAAAAAAAASGDGGSGGGGSSYSKGSKGRKQWGHRPWLDPEELKKMHHLRNDVMLALGSSRSLRDRHCGVPTQALGLAN